MAPILCKELFRAGTLAEAGHWYALPSLPDWGTGAGAARVEVRREATKAKWASLKSMMMV